MIAKTPEFLRSLQRVIEKFRPEEAQGTAEVSESDRAYLHEKLEALRAACEEYDNKTAKAVLGELRQKTWPRPVGDALSEISAHILHSDFDQAVLAADAAAAAAG